MCVNIMINSLGGKNKAYLKLHYLVFLSLRIQVCPEKQITPKIHENPILFGWDWNPQSCSIRRGSGFLGYKHQQCGDFVIFFFHFTK